MGKRYFACGALGLAALIAGAATADAQTAIPDFSGRWGRNAFGFEPLPSGPQPVANLSRTPDGGSNISQLVGDYKNPILKPEIAELVKRKGEQSLAGHTYPDPSNQCRPYNPPFTLAMQLTLEMLQTKDQVTLLYDQDDQVRRVRMNSPHPANVKPSPMGDSVGHYEGDTLVIDTVGVQSNAFAMIGRYGEPVTDRLHIVERYRLIDGVAAKAAQDRYEKIDGRLGGKDGVRPIDDDTKYKGLQVELTIDDPNVYTTPWSATVTYRRVEDSLPWEEHVCAENPNEYYKDRWIGLPKSDKPEF